MRLFFRVSSTLVLAFGTVFVALCQSATSAKRHTKPRFLFRSGRQGAVA